MRLHIFNSNVIQLYSDGAKSENDTFFLTTTIWGKPGACDRYSKHISDVHKIISENGIALKIFHAVDLNKRNWDRFYPAYIQVINKLMEFIENRYLRMMIFIESKEKYINNSKELEDTLKTYICNRNHPFGNIYQSIHINDLIAIYKETHTIYNYLRNRDIFGEDDQQFEYYPDASGKILQYGSKKTFLKSPNSPGLLMTEFYDVIRMIAQHLSTSLADVLKWGRINRQRLVKYEPKNDEDSFLIQSADIICNFFLSTIKYLVGIDSGITRKKALALLAFNCIRSSKTNILNEFINQNGKCVCRRPDCEVRFSFYG